MSPELIRIAKEAPMLSREKELGLFQQYRSIDYQPLYKKQQIKDRIILAHLRMCVSSAFKWKKKSRLSGEALFAEAQIGMLKAFDRFDPEKGFRFSTYAAWWVKAEVQGLVYQQSTSMKTATTSFQKFLFGNYNRVKKDILKFNPDLNRAELDEAIARRLVDLNFSPYDYDKTRGEIRVFQVGRKIPASLSAPIGGDEDARELVDVIEGDSPTGEDVAVKSSDAIMGSEFLARASERLKPREWAILKARRLEDPKKTLEDLAGVYDLSRERIRQIEVKAFEKLQGFAQQEFGCAVNGKQAQRKPKKVVVPPINKTQPVSP